MDPTALLVMLAVGAVAGWLATFVVGTLKWGFIGTIVAGIIGGVVGGWLLNAAKIPINLGNPILNNVVISAIGAIVVIALAKLIT